MCIPLRPEQLDAVLGRAESEGMSHLEFLRALINEQANARRERSLAQRIRAAGFAQNKTLADFDWQFNAEVIDRVRIETLAGGEFIGRRQNLVWVGQSGVGKSHLIQAIGLRACVLGYRVMPSLRRAGLPGSGPCGVNSGKQFSRGIHQMVRQDCLSPHETALLLPSKLRPRQHSACGNLKRPR